MAQSINRQYFEFSSRITGPVFSRIFNAGATEGVKLKHVIEPVFTIRRVSAIDVFDQIVRLESSDYTVGDVWQFGYGLNNRLYAKRTTSREVLSRGGQPELLHGRERGAIRRSSFRAAASRPP